MQSKRGPARILNAARQSLVREDERQTGTALIILLANFFIPSTRAQAHAHLQHIQIIIIISECKPYSSTIYFSVARHGIFRVEIANAKSCSSLIKKLR